MKRVLKIFSLILALCLCLSLCPGAWAADEKVLSQDYANMTPEQLMDFLLEEYSMKAENVYAGYLNLATGEEHYWQGDERVYAGSMYKVPLNMLVAEKMDKGELNWEERAGGTSYDEVLEQTILYSSNEWAMYLYDLLGGYSQFRTEIAPYMGIDTDSVEESYFQDNLFTARQMITCMKTLYEGGDERFPRIIETMQQAEPDRFFRYDEDRFDIAQKYGFVEEFGYYYMNCCALCYTDEPIAIVMFTRGAPYAEELLTGFCTAMCEYTQYQAQNRKTQADEALREELAQATPEPVVVPEATASPSPTAAPAQEENKSEGTFMATVICCIAAVAAAALATVIILIKKKRYGLKVFWMLIAVAVSALAVILCAVGLKAGTIYAKPDGDPRAVAESYLTALCDGNYTEAYADMRDYTSLGLENPPQSDAGKAVYDALKTSYAFALLGDCKVDKLSAVQRISFTYLDLGKTQEDIADMTVTKLEALVKTLPISQVYDENNQYKSEVANKAYLEAVQAVMKDAAKYYSTIETELEIAYNGGKWQIVANPALLKALNGGTAY